MWKNRTNYTIIRSPKYDFEMHYNQHSHFYDKGLVHWWLRIEIYALDPLLSQRNSFIVI